MTGHMLSTGFTKEVNELVLRLAKEYNLPSIDRMDSPQDYQFTYIGYDGPSRTSAEKEESFIRSLNKLEAGKRYLFLDHPALDNEEMKTVFHIGYEQVALDRQGVTDLLTSPRVKQVIEEKGIKLISINQLTKGLPRSTPSKKLEKAMEKYLEAVKNAGQDLHSIMIVQHGNVLAEKWLLFRGVNRDKKIMVEDRIYHAEKSFNIYAGICAVIIICDYCISDGLS